MSRPVHDLTAPASGAAASVDTGRRRRQVRLLVAALAGAVLLTACTADDPAPTPSVSATESPEPRATPTLVASPSPSPSPSVEQIVMPERPAEMERTDEVGAVAAAEYFMRLFSYVLATGDLEEWNRVSAQDCGFCSSVRSRAEQIYGANGHITGGQSMIGEARALGYDEVLRAYAVEVPYGISAGNHVDRDGAILATLKPESGLAVVDVVLGDGGWRLLEGSGGSGPAS